MADPERPLTVRLEEGSRCICEGCYGTVRYVGEVPPSKGVWLGVEWDDPSRGKHSGDHDGVHYFTCSTPGSGSFIRPKKVSQGCTFIEALKKRYGGESHQLESGEDSEMYVMSGSRQTKPVEMVGAEKVARKQSQLDQLMEVSLREMLVSSAGKPGEIEAVAPNIRDLNLSQNLLLSNWKTLADICSQLQHMQTLNLRKLTMGNRTLYPSILTLLSENRCLSLPTDAVSLAPAFSCLRTLFINKMDLSWSQVCSILNLVPNLEELHACKNKITNLCPPDNISLPMGLRLLNLEENQLSDWSDIVQLQHLPLLKTLILNDNKLTQVLLPDASVSIGLIRGFLIACLSSHSSTCGFPALESLSLNQNQIADWSSLNVLDTFPSLVELKFKGNPLLQGEPAFTARQLVIARIGHLTFLNNSPITDRERQLAERYYLKQYATKWVSSQVDVASRKQFSALHPRYAHLAEVHGLPEEAMVAQQSPASSLKDQLIAVTIKCPDHPEQKQLAKKLPGTMTIQKLKGLLQRMYKVNSSDQKLSYVDKRGECEIELSDDLKQLSFYSIETGDTILLRW